MPSLIAYGLAVLLLTVAGLILVFRLSGRKQPGRRRFTCAHCATLTAHNPRTLQAWHNGRGKFFCDACHGEWTAKHSAPPLAYQAEAERRGCLGMVAVVAAMPLLMMLAWYWG